VGCSLTHSIKAFITYKAALMQQTEQYKTITENNYIYKLTSFN